MFKITTRLMLAAANFLFVGSAVAGPAPAPHAGASVETLNAASVKAVEASWLEVPNACKARGFNADAQPVAMATPQPHVSDIYAAFAV